jgi:hypothetical protein
MEGLPFMLGRDFLPEEDQPGKDHVVILSNRLWTRAFEANREIIGKQIRMNGEPYTVVGVWLPAYAIVSTRSYGCRSYRRQIQLNQVRDQGW